jgi:hypothetical protein
MELKKYYKIFVSSVGTLLENERRIIINMVLGESCYPICMENFSSQNNVPPINEVINKLNESDIVIIVLGHLYGEEIKGLDKTNCPLTDCEKCKDSGNCISYTHFEYLYSVQEKKNLYCMVKEKYDEDIIFEESIKKLKPGYKSYANTNYYTNKGKHTQFVAGVRKNFVHFYNTDDKIFPRQLSLVFSDIHNHVNTSGLIDSKHFDALKNELDLCKKELSLYKDVPVNILDMKILNMDYTPLFNRLKNTHSSLLNPDQKTALGLMYELGLGADRDMKKAKEYYLEAKESGNSLANSLLGRSGCYEED